MKTANSKGILTKVYDSNYKLLSSHKSTKEACKEYGINYGTVLDFKRRNPEEKAYTVWEKRYTKVKYILMWGI